jgi:hypothetical protein
MSKSAMTAGGGMDKEAARRSIDTPHHAENGETFHERHLAFEAGMRSPRADRHTVVVIDALAQGQFGLRQVGVMIL